MPVLNLNCTPSFAASLASAGHQFHLAQFLFLGSGGAVNDPVLLRSEAQHRSGEFFDPGGPVGLVQDLVEEARQAQVLAVDAAHLGSGQLVVDLVYRPAITPLIDAARAAGAVATNGLGMLIHQAAHAFRLWTGEDPPLEAMSAAALSALTSADGPSPAPR